MAALTVKVLQLILLSAILFFSFSDAADFCVADLKAARSASGYACKNPESVTVDDFVFTKLAVAGNTNNNISAAPLAAFVQQFPALNGLGLAMARADHAPGGVIPMHTHPAAAEIIYVESGSVTAGFISSANVAYVKKLKKGEIMVIPRGLLHFQINTGNVPATVIAAFSDPEPGVQITANSLFSNDLASKLLEKSTFLDDAEVKRLKGVFGGTG